MVCSGESTWIINKAVKFRVHIHGSRSADLACVFVHGTAEGAFVWDDIVAAIAGDITAYTLDLRGHGDSSWDPDSDYFFEKYVSDVRYILDALQLKEFILIGHSLGADIVIRLAPELTRRLRGIIVVDSGPNINRQVFELLAHHLNESNRAYKSFDEYSLILKQQRIFAPKTTLDRIARNSLRRDEDGSFSLKFDPAIVKTLTSFQFVDWWSASLPRIDTPVLIVRGSASAVLPNATALRILDLAQDGALETISNAGHAVMTDNAVEFEKIVKSFLSKIDLR